MTRKLWQVALALWFLLYGLLALTNFRFAMQDVVMGVLALLIAVLWVADR